MYQLAIDTFMKNSHEIGFAKEAKELVKGRRGNPLDCSNDICGGLRYGLSGNPVQLTETQLSQV